MQLGFATTDVGKLCNSGRKLAQILGSDIAENVKDLLYYLDAAPTLADLSRSPPILRKQKTSQIPHSYSVGRAGRGQVLFYSLSQTNRQVLTEIESINIISVGETV